MSTFNQALDQGDVLLVDKVSVEEAQKEGFGLSLPSLSGLGKIFKSDGSRELPEDVKQVEFAIKSVEGAGYNKKKFIMENEQVWVQVEAVDIRVPREKDGQKNMAHISRAALGSYQMRINGKGKKVRVRRVQ